MTWITTETGYTAAVDLAAKMGTSGAQQWAERKRPGTPIPEPTERWIEDGWVEQAAGQLTLF